MDRIVNEKIINLVDGQAAILAIQNSIVKSDAMLTCIKNLNILDKDNDVTIAGTPGHIGIQKNEMADILAKSGSALKCLGPEPFISILYASCRAAIKDWTVKRWKTSWVERKDCLRKKESVEWASPQLTQRLLRLKKPTISEVLQILTGHCNLQKHRSTIGHDVSSTCPKSNLEEETPNHHDGECTYYQALRKKVFGEEKNHNKVGGQKTKYKPTGKVFPAGPEDLPNTAKSKFNKRESGESCNGPK